MASLSLFIGSFFTDQKYEVFLAIVFFMAVLFITLQDISLDAMAIK